LAGEVGAECAFDGVGEGEGGVMEKGAGVTLGPD
jgi:hypothetical protein